MFFPGLKDKNTVVGQDESRTTANTKGAGGGGGKPPTTSVTGRKLARSPPLERWRAQPAAFWTGRGLAAVHKLGAPPAAESLRPDPKVAGRRAPGKDARRQASGKVRSDANPADARRPLGFPMFGLPSSSSCHIELPTLKCCVSSMPTPSPAQTSSEECATCKNGEKRAGPGRAAAFLPKSGMR